MLSSQGCYAYKPDRFSETCQVYHKLFVKDTLSERLKITWVASPSGDRPQQKGKLFLDSS